jgi:hypothetical protein
VELGVGRRAEIVGVDAQRRCRAFSGGGHRFRMLPAAQAAPQPGSGSGYSRGLGEQFVELLQPIHDRITHADARTAAWACFDTVFATVIIRIACGSDFATPVPGNDQDFLDRLAETAVRYLLGSGPG